MRQVIFFMMMCLCGQSIWAIEPNPQVGRQIKGDYGVMQRQESLPLGAVQEAWNQAKPSDGIYTVNFHPLKHIKLRLREHMQSTLQFPAWEVIDKVSVGDNTVVKADILKPHVVLLSPQQYIGADTDVKAYGQSGHIYTFYVRAEGYNSQRLPDVTVFIRAQRPYEWAAGVGDDKASSTSPRINLHYAMSGSRAIAPLQVYDDGKRMILDYGQSLKHKRLPVVLAVIDEVDTPVNVHREGNKLLVQHIGHLCLRNGKERTCIYPTTA